MKNLHVQFSIYHKICTLKENGFELNSHASFVENRYRCLLEVYRSGFLKGKIPVTNFPFSKEISLKSLESLTSEHDQFSSGKPQDSQECHYARIFPPDGVPI